MKKKILITITILAILMATCLAFVGCVDNSYNDDIRDNISDNDPETPIFLYEEIVDRTLTSTVCVYSSNFKGTRASSGSGFIISSDGYIVTNYHVVKGYKFYEVVVRGDDGKDYSYDATLFTQSTNPDIAVLKISSYTPFKPIKFGKSAKTDFGDTCVMIGNPKGVGFMSARGMISNPSVKIDGVKYIAIDAPVNPGNSGGALIDANCQVIGVITSRYTSSGTVNDVVMNIGFAQHTEDVVNFLLKNSILKEKLDYWS